MGQHHVPVPRQAEGRHLTAPDDAPAAGEGDPPEAPARADETALEAGRLLFAGEWGLRAACHSIGQLPAAGPPEVAFAGRSNVGKSSLLNTLTGRKQLARSSNTPGRTRALYLYGRTDGTGPIVVDMPGYGYARAPKQEVAAWTALVFDYLRGRPNLRRVFLLVDARHGVKASDLEAMKVLDEAAVSYQAVLTKADKAGRVRAEVLSATEAALARRPAAHPEVLLTAATTGEGIPALRSVIAAIAAD